MGFDGGGRDVLVFAPGLRERSPLARAAWWRGLLPDAPRSGDRVHYYGGPLYADTVLDDLGVGLLEPADTWLTSLPRELLNRAARLCSLAEAWGLDKRAFVKPPTSKAFVARVYDDGSDLLASTAHLSPETLVQVAQVVEFAAEYRLFLLGGRIHASSRYLTWGRLDPGWLEGSPHEGRVHDFVATLGRLAGDSLPSAVVLDVGLHGPADDPERHVSVVEANMAWFSQPYHADLDRVLDVVLRAAGPLSAVSERDRPFVRQPVKVADG
ncbi:ATP-grasp domain-containing protein [Promicromonospora sp. MEB111]|uniref:ATP-grasp domain-containing protein n=1 Tax=Promicromonospora sp. MEB111 TaxID=3040301 RepID=UPI00254AA757|nr:ATP-grasp domain-containing protein [Promicromonospora sp. MEB111]